MYFAESRSLDFEHIVVVEVEIAVNKLQSRAVKSIEGGKVFFLSDTTKRNARVQRCVIV